MAENNRVIDLTMVISSDTRVYPGSPQPSVGRYKTHQEQGVQVTRLDMSVHAGTHMDAPRHFFPEGVSIDQLPLDKLMGEAVLLDLGYLAPGSRIELPELKPFAEKIRPGDIVTIYTAYEKCLDDEKYCFLAPEAAQRLVDRGIKCLGMDSPSVDPLNRTGGTAGRQTHPAHHVLLGAGIPIVEGLVNLKALPEGRFHFCCLPLSIAGGDGSPARAVAVLP